MFGKNPIAKKRLFDGTYAVQEVFPTIQGEGPLSGMPALFIRLSGCNLACAFCDTDFTTSKWEPTLDTLLTDIEAKLGASKCVVITGGEPMIQDIGPLCAAIVSRFKMPVQIETAGTAWPDSFTQQPCAELLENSSIMLVCSPKTGKVVPQIAAHCRHWKYIISAHDELDSIDGLPCSSTQVKGQHLRLFRPSFLEQNTIWVQPCDEYLVPFILPGDDASHIRPVPDVEGTKASLKKTVEVSIKYGYRLSIQVHKVIGVS